ncbi:MAG: hypothetical protein FJY42_01355 [Betaproteobacteria bacterium]|nr:hypothetical protein [Betaproteobacteria bacterium]
MRPSRPFNRPVLGLLLSWLALCSALLAPASVLAQQMSEGKWSIICSVAGSTLAAPEGHADGGEGHCPLCLLPTMALPGVCEPVRALGASPPAPSDGADFGSMPQGQRPFIRGPPDRP